MSRRNFTKFKSEYRQPGTANFAEFKYGLFDCCDSMQDCLLAYLCPSCYVYFASQEADQGFVCSFLHCFFYPFGMCFLRNAVRESRAISVSSKLFLHYDQNLVCL